MGTQHDTRPALRIILTQFISLVNVLQCIYSVFCITVYLQCILYYGVFTVYFVLQCIYSVFIEQVGFIFPTRLPSL